jgi:hypothetical protein
MTHPARSFRALALCLILSPAPLLAQQQPAARPQTRTKTRPTAVAEADPVAEARRASAVALVNSLADEARNFSDPVLRANVQARAADVLWEADEARARALFRRAWEAAETVDKESGEKRAREAGRRGAPNSRDAGSLRREVLRLAARRDNTLGNEFLKRLDESSKQDVPGSATEAAANAPAAPAQRINPDDPPSTMTQRLSLAAQLLDDGDVERAMQFADPALYPVNTFGVDILNRLRERDAKAADQRFLSLLQRAVGDPSADANTVSLLSSYVFTPYLYITVRPDGNSHTRQWRRNTTPPADLDPRLRESYLRAAAQILTRPLPPVEQDPTSSGRTGAYVVASRLAPLFEQYAPDLAAQVRTRQAALMQETPEKVRRPDNELYTTGLAARPSREEELQNMLGRVESAKTAKERDMIYFRIAMGLAEDDPARSREYAEKIEDVDVRRQLLGALAFRALELAVRNKRAEEAVKLAHADELTTVQRAWALTEAARLLAKDSPGRAVELLEEATVEAKRIDAGTADRVRALVAVATRMQPLDRQRAWDMMPEIVKASNATADFTGEDGQIMVRVQFKDGGAMTNNNSIESFDLAGLFASLAGENLDRAAELARGFKEESPRSAATLAAARAVLVKPRANAAGTDEQEVRN